MHASSVMGPVGHSPLWKVFWLYGVIPSNLLWGVVLWMLSHGGYPGATLGLLAFLLLYTAWIVVAVWRAAPNAGDPRYGVVARTLTVAWALNTVLMVFFLGLQLLR
ncbi:hypothetical protein OK348_08580 [Flavobacterium sp. MXW15]|uniref:Uncharacterized protein n=1 Tax=Xanthomonas chitinilytica TaxID=2989819 RepID=A0ABT3JWJ0_9XANT|nr:hypothetical protein [Xanthomonas sp. H13-6]MCW4454852.1 hypothetical protein [Flavobacterium sp. MXW15]MCW4472520.1 hypothetical protein [Xanthomonas sp. H13-6]